MKPQGEKKMKTSSKAALIAIGLIVLLAAGSAFAQPSGTMRANVPFQFQAGDKVTPAGEYRVEIDPAFHRMALRRADGSAALYISAHLSRKTGDAPEMATLVFHKYGNQFFLRAAWNGRELSGYELPLSRAEREMARLASTREAASVRVN
jgi:hypothetical protein